MPGAEEQDCLPCRLIGGFSFIGISCYIYYNSRAMSPRSKPPMIVISSIFGIMGIARLLGLKPFDTSTTERN